jgi:arylsulfatase A-like enzyme
MIRVFVSFLILLTFLVRISSADERPNIVFLFADDQCTYSMGCYGTPGVKTPHLDKLAKDGIAFDRHYDTTAICMGSRANVMTGKYEYKTGCNFDHGPLLNNLWQATYPILLRKAGYSTAFAGKFGFEVVNQVGAKKRLPASDFDRWGGGPGQTSYVTKRNRSMAQYAEKYPHSTLSYGAFSRDYIADAAKSEKPFCLSISFKAPHRPVSPDPKFDDVYEAKSFTKPKNFGRENGEHFSLQSRTGRQFVRFHEWKYSSDYDKVMALYYQQIYAIDVAVGMVRKALADNGVDKNTVVIYTSDNGFFCGSHGYGSKVLPYEEGSRVPLIMYDPRHKNSGKELRCQAVTGNIDFAATMLELAGEPVPKAMDGQSLLPLYDDPQAKIRKTLSLINVWGPKSCHSFGIVTQDWKYIYWPYSNDKLQPTEELYNITTDPLELRNAIKTAPATTVKKMRAAYDDALTHWVENGVPYHGYKECGESLKRRVD